MRDDNDVVKSGLRAIARASATVVCGARISGSGVMSAPTVSGEKSINRRTGADSSGSMSSSSTSALSSGSSPSKSAASSGSISSSTTAARSMARASMSSACRSSGSSWRMSARRSSSSCSATVWRSAAGMARSKDAMSAGRMLSNRAISSATLSDCPAPAAVIPCTWDHGTTCRLPRRPNLGFSPNTATRETIQSLVRVRSSSMSAISTGRPWRFSSSGSSTCTLEPTRSPTMVNSPVRGLNARKLTDPDTSMISCGSIDATRSIGRKIRRLLTTSTTSPNARVTWPLGRTMTTTSRTRPITSVSGPRTTIPARRPA